MHAQLHIPVIRALWRSMRYLSARNAERLIELMPIEHSVSAAREATGARVALESKE